MQTRVLVGNPLTSQTDTQHTLHQHTTAVLPWSTRVIMGSSCTGTAALLATTANGEILLPVEEQVRISFSSWLKHKFNHLYQEKSFES